ncbi:MAG: peptidylprolyl isomerase [Candidatus Doudnabacteria bacterium]
MTNAVKISSVIAAIIVIAAVVIIVKNNKGGSREEVKDMASQAENKQPENQTNPCADASQKDSNGKFKPAVDIANKTAVLQTSMGEISIKLYDQDAPKTVQNFVCLIQKGYYDGIKFHRVSHGFVIQAGDPTGTGAGGESIFGGKFEDELNPETASYKEGYVEGVLAMANSGPNTNGSQFFIMTDTRTDLSHAYTIFGKVTAGLDVVKKIGAVPVEPGPFGTEDGAPKTPVLINKAIIK